MSDLFTRPLEVWRSTSAPDGMGGTTQTWAKVAGPLLWKVDQPSGKDLRIGSAYGATLTHAIYGDGDVDVRRLDELRDPGVDADPAGAALPVDGEHVYVVRYVAQPSEPVYTKALSEIRQVEGGEV